ARSDPSGLWSDPVAASSPQLRRRTGCSRQAPPGRSAPRRGPGENLGAGEAAAGSRRGLLVELDPLALRPLRRLVLELGELLRRQVVGVFALDVRDPLGPGPRLGLVE